jgi:GNAT superfamily N-acetyltransferase
MGMTIVVRAAGLADVDALAALRASMFESMGTAGVDDPGWLRAARVWFTTHLHHPDVALRVVEVDGEVVAGAVAHVRRHLPSPGNASGRVVTISNVSTLAPYRGRGFGRLAFEAVMEWTRESSRAEGAELVATGMGQEMYAGAGFTLHPMPAMRLPLPKS